MRYIAITMQFVTITIVLITAIVIIGLNCLNDWLGGNQWAIKGEKINGNIRYPVWYKRGACKISKFKYGCQRGVKVELLRVVIIFLENYRIDRNIVGGSFLKRVASNVVCSRRCACYPRYRRRKVEILTAFTRATFCLEPLVFPLRRNGLSRAHQPSS